MNCGKAEIMKFNSVGLMCIAKQEPNEWEYNNRKGVTYKATFSDAFTVLTIRLKDEEIYNAIEPFKKYNIGIDVVERSNEHGSYMQATVVSIS